MLKTENLYIGKKTRLYSDNNFKKVPRNYEKITVSREDNMATWLPVYTILDETEWKRTQWESIVRDSGESSVLLLDNHSKDEFQILSENQKPKNEYIHIPTGRHFLFKYGSWDTITEEVF
jgi:hypothetical protein